ncbi:MAG: S9 family peptidase, partial [Isosphaeraceae bacterium]
ARAGALVADPSLLTIDRILNGPEFRTEGFGPARWLADGSGYTTLERSADGKGREIVRYRPDTGAREVLIAAADLIPQGKSTPLEIADYSWSQDGTKLLIFNNTRRVWRLNTRGDYWVFDRAARTLKRLGGDGPEATLMFAKFDPAGTRVAYVRNQDVYVEDLRSGAINRLTEDGSPTLSNGTSDWVYEEEFAVRDGFRWSPDGSLIAYWQVDSAEVPEYLLVNTTDSLYPRTTPIRYPKVGQINPSCRLGVVDSRGGPTVWIAVQGDPRDHYIPRIEWATDSREVVFQRMDRRQSTIVVMAADARSGQSRELFTDRDEAWIDVVDDFRWIDRGQRFTWMSESDGWKHVFTVPREGGEPHLMTPGSFDVQAIVRIDEVSGTMDFYASPDNATQRYLYRIGLDGKGHANRLTPEDQPGTHDYQISGDGRWAFHTYSRFDRPPVIELVELPAHRVVRTLVDNAAVRAKLATLAPVASEFFRVEIGDGIELDGWCLKPPGFDSSKKYPVLVHVYGEPAAQTVLDQWGGRHGLWHQMMAQRGYVVLSMDNRGTPAPKGRAWRKSVYRQIGILASQDQAAALKALLDRWAFLDRDRVAVWGWSGGGSMSLNLIFRYPELYKSAVAIAFISDQRLYDTIYQERYMGLLADNPDGYRAGSPISHAEGLRGNLLLIHGTGDDNCHYQSCERLVNRLIELDKPFEMLAYPNRTHAISEGPNTSRHLYGSITRFIERTVSTGPRDR